jgi:GT2 family glycosyltransferase
MISKKSISVILPNYNGKHLMEMYIPSVIEALNYSGVNYEFIVIDDCSTDNSVAFIENHYSEIKLLKNKKNSGFSYTCNQGISIATKELILLLNSDVKLTPDYFEAQWQYFDIDNTFGVMGCIMNFDGKKIEDAARLPKYKGSKFKANTFYYSENKLDIIYTTYLSGANALIDREKLKLLKGFNELFSPFYFEDFDLGLRAWQMGWNLYYEHQSKCFHRVSASTNTMNKSNFVKIIYNRNSMILQSIHLKGLKRKFWFIQLLTLNLINHFIKGEFWILKSINQFLKMSNAVKQSKKDITALQEKIGNKKTLDDIINTIKSSIKDKDIKWL